MNSGLSMVAYFWLYHNTRKVWQIWNLQTMATVMAWSRQRHAGRDGASHLHCFFRHFHVRSFLGNLGIWEDALVPCHPGWASWCQKCGHGWSLRSGACNIHLQHLATTVERHLHRFALCAEVARACANFGVSDLIVPSSSSLGCYMMVEWCAMRIHLHPYASQGCTHEQASSCGG